MLSYFRTFIAYVFFVMHYSDNQLCYIDKVIDKFELLLLHLIKLICLYKNL